jgi:hypothetical protein
MPAVTKYECSVCLHVYDTEQEAIDCADAHLAIGDLALDAVTKPGDGQAIPREITITADVGGTDYTCRAIIVSSEEAS